MRSLAPAGVRTIAVSELETTPAFQSAYCDEAVVTAAPDEDFSVYTETLRSLAERPAVETIIPVREADVYALAAHRDEFEPHVGTPWPSLETLAAVQDRRRLFAAAEEAGVSAPETHALDECDDWGREWIVKPRYSILTDTYCEDVSADVCIAPPSTTYLHPGEEPDVDALVDSMGHVPICQEYVDSDGEYGFFALYDEGEAVATFQHRQRRGWSYAGGPSAFRESISDPALERAGRDLLDHLEWHGLAMVEFLRDEHTGTYQLMEINPRFWSSLPFSVQAGADFPAYYWQLATGRRERIDCDYEVGVGGHLLRGELLYLHSILADEVDLVDRPALSSALLEVTQSLYAHPRFDYFQLDDVRPFVRDALDTYAAFRRDRT
ncbi:carboxylate--amine ligase [Natronobiforma cellulositropha]|uniref:carboxylate--amine ligase n=1 Tax=Natronobiforma cellulositropha TaxID=1679076 RepID=UPI003CCCD087